MREMVLNHASIVIGDRQVAVQWLKDVTIGMSELVRAGVVASILRMSRPEYETMCVADWTLFDAYQELRHHGERDAYLFLVKLGSKVPLLDDVGIDVANRFRQCEERELTSPDGEPLVLCAITDWVAVGFPSESSWDSDSVIVSFDELMPDGSIREASERVDNLTRQTHSLPICERHRERVLDGVRDFRDSAAMWEARGEAFPHLSFGPDVERHLTVLNHGDLGTVVNKLAGLDRSAMKWRISGGPVPTWESHVTNESASVRNTPRLRDARRFRSVDGSFHLYMWHARFGNSGRIHLRFEVQTQIVEIGYIGSHLPI